MAMRILIFEDDVDMRRMLGMFLRTKGYEVLDYPTPATCTLVNERQCNCRRDFACADVIITDMNMPGMSGLELVKLQQRKGCRIPVSNKAVISAALTAGQEGEFLSLGCHIIRKPFKLVDILAWLRTVEERVPDDRQLTPLVELWETAALRVAN